MKKFKIMILVILLSMITVASTQAHGEGFQKVTKRVLVRGARLHGTNGIAFDNQGRLYIASALGQEIIVMNPQTGKILERFGSESGVVGPDDLTFGPDGSLYWTDILSGEVGRRTPGGEVTKQFVAEFVNPIAFTDNGRLFVAQAFVGDGLYEVDPELENPPVKILGEGNPALHLNGMDFGPDGKLYAPRQQLNQIVRIDVDTAEVEILTDQFEGACKFDSQGQLHVATDGSVIQFDPDTGNVETVAILPDGGTDNIAFNAQNKLFVSNFRDGSIYRILPGGQLRTLSRGGLTNPGGIAILPEEHGGESLFVADFWTVRNYNARTGRSGDVGEDFFFDAPVTAAPDGENIILTSWFGNTVTVWNPETQTKLEVHGDFAVPINAIRFQDDFIVAELGSGKLIRQDENGIRTDLATGLGVPSGLAAVDNDLWAADWATGHVWQIVSDGIVLDPPELSASGLVAPEGLAVDRDGSLLVIESGAGQLSRIDPTTGDVRVLADNLALGVPAAPGWPPTWIFNGVAVGKWGAIYVTGDVDNVIYRIKVWN